MEQELETTRERSDASSATASAFDKITDRKKFLGGLFLASAGTALGVAGSASQRAAAAVQAPYATKAANLPTSPDGRPAVWGPQIAADGFPKASITGVFIRTDGNVIYLKTEKQAAPVGILIAPDTAVDAAGQSTMGDVSAVQRGDELFVGTYFDSLGRRVAGYAIANLKCYWATVTSIAGSRLECWTDYYGDAPDSKVSIMLTDSTRFIPAPPKVGNYIYAFATSSAGSKPRSIWARDIRVTTKAS